jgi:hypothetical protein
VARDIGCTSSYKVIALPCTTSAARNNCRLRSGRRSD